MCWWGSVAGATGKAAITPVVAGRIQFLGACWVIAFSSLSQVLLLTSYGSLLHANQEGNRVKVAARWESPSYHLITEVTFIPLPHSNHWKQIAKSSHTWERGFYKEEAASRLSNANVWLF